jgi:hypothetical protein
MWKIGVLAAVLSGGLALAGGAVAVPPANTEPPEVTSDLAAPGSYELSATAGAWSGDAPLAFAFRWQSCPAAGDDVDRCSDIAGATGQTVVVTPTDELTAYRVVVTATNGDGSAVAGSAIYRLRAPALAPLLPPQPAQLRLVPVRAPATVARGRALVVRVRVLRPDTGRSVPSAAVTCRLLVGGALVRASLAAWRDGSAICSWTVPKRQRPVQVRLTLGVRSGDLSASRVFLTRIVGRP